MPKKLWMGLLFMVAIQSAAYADSTTSVSKASIAANVNQQICGSEQGAFWLKPDGSLWYWSGPQRSSSVAALIQLEGGFSAIASGCQMAFKPDGSLWFLGFDTQGRHPVSPTFVAGAGYIAVASISNSFSSFTSKLVLAVKNDGSLWYWNINQGVVDKPIQIGTDTGYMSVAIRGDVIRGFIFYALKGDGSLWQFFNDYQTTASKIGSGFSAIAVGSDHFLALKSDNSLWAWGSNNFGQLGNGTTTDQGLPVQVGTGFVTISAFADFSFGLKADGTLWAWGSNGYGQLGDGTETNRNSPTKIGSGFTNISAGFALKTDGSFWEWPSPHGTGPEGYVPLLTFDASGKSVANIQWLPASVSFNLPGGNTGLYFRNIGITDVVIDNITVTGDFTVNSGCPNTLRPGDGCQFNVSFTPTAMGDWAGKVSVNTNNPLAQTASVFGKPSARFDSATNTIVFNSAKIDGTPYLTARYAFNSDGSWALKNAVVGDSSTLQDASVPVFSTAAHTLVIPQLDIGTSRIKNVSISAGIDGYWRLLSIGSTTEIDYSGTWSLQGTTAQLNIKQYGSALTATSGSQTYTGSMFTSSLGKITYKDNIINISWWVVMSSATSATLFVDQCIVPSGYYCSFPRGTMLSLVKQ